MAAIVVGWQWSARRWPSSARWIAWARCGVQLTVGACTEYHWRKWTVTTHWGPSKMMETVMLWMKKPAVCWQSSAPWWRWRWCWAFSCCSVALLGSWCHFSNQSEYLYFKSEAVLRQNSQSETWSKEKARETTGESEEVESGETRRRRPLLAWRLNFHQGAPPLLRALLLMLNQSGRLLRVYRGYPDHTGFLLRTKWNTACLTQRFRSWRAFLKERTEQYLMANIHWLYTVPETHKAIT